MFMYHLIYSFVTGRKDRGNVAPKLLKTFFLSLVSLRRLVGAGALCVCQARVPTSSPHCCPLFVKGTVPARRDRVCETLGADVHMLSALLVYGRWEDKYFITTSCGF